MASPAVLSGQARAPGRNRALSRARKGNKLKRRCAWRGRPRQTRRPAGRYISCRKPSRARRPVRAECAGKVRWAAARARVRFARRSAVSVRRGCLSTQEERSYGHPTGQCSTASFPLALTLSLVTDYRGRDAALRRPRAVQARNELVASLPFRPLHAGGDIAARCPYPPLPLPKGEGRGEGKRARRVPHAVKPVESQCALLFHSAPPTSNAARCASS